MLLCYRALLLKWSRMGDKIRIGLFDAFLLGSVQSLLDVIEGEVRQSIKGSSGINLYLWAYDTVCHRSRKMMFQTPRICDFGPYLIP